MDALVNFIIDDDDLLQQKLDGFNLGFKSPIALLKWNEMVKPTDIVPSENLALEEKNPMLLHRHADEGGKVKESNIRPIFNSEELKIALLQIWHNENLHDACIQKFVKLQDLNSPTFVRTVWSRNIQEKTKSCEGYVIKSNINYLANVQSHLDPVNEATAKTSKICYLEAAKKELKGADGLVDMTHAVMSDLQKYFGRGGVLNNCILNWTQGKNDGLWYIVSICNLTAVSAGPTRRENAARRPMPSWLIENSLPTSKGYITQGGENNVKKVQLRAGEKECEGDFCETDNENENKKKAVVNKNQSKNVMFKSILKARKEFFGYSGEGKDYNPKIMNQSHTVCAACYRKYRRLDAERMGRMRAKMEEVEEEKAIEKKRKMKPAGFKSRVQLQYEQELDKEKEQMLELLRSKKKAKLELQRRVRLRAQGIEEGNGNEEEEKRRKEEEEEKAREFEVVPVAEYTNAEEDKDASYPVTRPASPTGRHVTRVAGRRATVVRKATDSFLMLLSPQRKKKEAEDMRKAKEKPLFFANFNNVLNMLKKRGVEEEEEEEGAEGEEGEE